MEDMSLSEHQLESCRRIRALIFPLFVFILDYCPILRSKMHIATRDQEVTRRRT